jgi:hypothetical protein
LAINLENAYIWRMPIDYEEVACLLLGETDNDGLLHRPRLCAILAFLSPSR